MPLTEKKTRLDREDLPDFYSAISAEYDDPALHPVTNRFRSMCLTHLERRLAGRRFTAALDIGCGPGGFLQAVNARTRIGMDISRGMLARHARRLPSGLYVGADAARGLPLRAGSIDLAHAGFFIDHVEDLRGFFADVRRVLKHPGDLLILCHYEPEKIVSYRGSAHHFTFQSSAGATYLVPSRYPSHEALARASAPYFRLRSRRTLGTDELSACILTLAARE